LTKLAVIVHGNDEVSVLDERRTPFVCAECRFAGWLTEYEFRTQLVPPTCLHYCGGADPQDGDRVLYDEVLEARYGREYRPVGHPDLHWRRVLKGGHLYLAARHRGRFPLCRDKNPDGRCEDFVRARPLPPVPWWLRIIPFAYRRRRDALRRKMRP
jgi:hypothetical protein